MAADNPRPMADSPALPTAVKSVELQNPAATEALAGAVASQARVRDVVALFGGLGAGKTAFARGFLRALPGGEAIAEVPSPTFTLVQFYEGPRLKVAHFDLYRLSDPDEAYEIGLDEALEDGAVVIEWPERLHGRLPADRLDIEIGLAEDTEGRRVRIVPHGAWEGRGLEFRT